MNIRAITSLLLLATLAFLGCKPDNSKERAPVEERVITIAPTDKSIVVYFSRAGEQMDVGFIVEGNTSIVARNIANKVGADLFEVKPKVDKYNLSYRQLSDLAKKEQDVNARPEYLEPGPDLSQYDVIFFGAPVWWSDWPMIMYTFFEANELQGKKLIPFSTHAGGALSGFDRKLSRYYPYCDILRGHGFLGETAQNNPTWLDREINDWLKVIGFEIKPETENAAESTSEELDVDDSVESPSPDAGANSQ